MGSSAIKGLGGGLLIQQRYSETGDYITCTTGIPLDDTTPQSDEGDEVMTVNITPTSTNTILKIDVCVFSGTNSSADNIAVALFKDSDTDAIATGWSTNSGVGDVECIKFTHYMQSGTTSNITFKVRVGCNGGNNALINASATGAKFNELNATSITVSEIGLGVGGGGGIVVQQVNTETGEYASGSTIMNYDDTIPLYDEGNEWLTLSITPTSSNNTLVIESSVIMAADHGFDVPMLALFQDGAGTDPAIACVFGGGDSSSTNPRITTLRHYMQAGTTSATTFQIRGGSKQAGTVVLNGNNDTTSRIGGGTASSYISITELGSGVGSSRAGQTVQVVNVQDGEVSTGSTAIPYDDSIPAITEGDEFMTLAITPTSATNKLKIDVVVQGDSGAAVFITAALFQDSTVNALAAICDYEVNGRGGIWSFTHYMDAGTTSSTTFRVRVGGTSGTFTFNGVGSSRRMGGVMASSITITEIAV